MQSRPFFFFFSSLSFIQKWVGLVLLFLCWSWIPKYSLYVWDGSNHLFLFHSSFPVEIFRSILQLLISVCAALLANKRDSPELHLLPAWLARLTTAFWLLTTNFFFLLISNIQTQPGYSWLLLFRSLLVSWFLNKALNFKVWKAQFCQTGACVGCGSHCIGKMNKKR